MIYFVRHGETDYNKKGIYQGQLDIELNDEGLNQAMQARENLKNIKFDEIYSSPLKRALKTAEIINEYHNLEIKTDDRIKEFFGGEMQGKVYDKIPKDILDDFHNNPAAYGAETWQGFFDRIVSFFKEVENSDKNILIVGHGGTYRNIYKYINKTDRFDFKIDKIRNAQIVEIKPN